MAGDAREGFKLVKQTIEEVGDPHRTISAAADAVLLARGGNQRGGGNGDRVRAHGEGLGKVGGNAQPAGDHQGNVALCIVEEFADAAGPLSSFNQKLTS